MPSRFSPVRSFLLLPFLTGLVAGASAFAQESVTLEEVFQALKLTEAEKQALNDGKFVQRKSDETSKFGGRSVVRMEPNVVRMVKMQSLNTVHACGSRPRPSRARAIKNTISRG